MKLNFKKIASIIASTVMLGSTMAFATAAWPDPFVKSGAGDAALVVGAAAAATDMAAATDLGAELDKSVTAAGATSLSGEGDKVKIEKSSNKFNLGDQLDDFYATFDNEELSTILADGVYLNQDNNDYEYTQEIALSAEPLVFTHDQDYNDDKPTAMFDFSSGDTVVTYTLDFSDSAECGAALVNCDNTNLEILGKNFFISNAEVASSRIKLTMLDSANMATVAEGETKSLTVGTKSYEVSIDFVDSDEAKLTVNGVTTNSLNEGETYKLADGTFVGVKDISYNSKESGVSKVEFTLGMGKLVIDSGQEVQLNDKDISTIEDANGVSSVVTGTITNSSNNLESIVLTWTLDSDAVLAPGSELAMPGFNAIKLSMTGFNAPKAEKTTLDDSSDSVRLSTEVKDGPLTMSLLYANSSVSGFAGLGKDSTHKLVTAATGTSITLTLNETENSYFVASWYNGDDYETYAYELQSITEGTDSKNATVLNNLAGGSDVTFSEVSKDKDVGSINLKLQSANDDTKIATINITAASTGTIYADRIFTKEGLSMRLPVNSAALATDGYINLTAVPTTWVMNFTEEDRDGNVLANTESFTVTLGLDAGDGTEVTTTSLTGTSNYEEEDDSDWIVNHQVSDLATKVRFYNPSGDSLGKAEIIYAGEETTASVYIAEAGLVAENAAKIKVVKDSEVASVSGKNLIVVGGACINKAAAMIVAGKEDALCGDAWSAKTTAGAGKYLIQVVASPYNAQKVAMLVAGYEAADTTAAVAKVKEGKTSTDVGTKVVGPVAA